MFIYSVIIIFHYDLLDNSKYFNQNKFHNASQVKHGHTMDMHDSQALLYSD